MVIVKAVLWFALLGGIFGVLLAVASKIFAVKRDERAEKINEVLSGANCGGCGYAGCAAYAEAVAKGEAKVGLCNAGGNEVAQKMAEIMGVKADNIVRMRAVVHCYGGNGKAKKKYIYEGAPDCVSASKMGGGDRTCPFGCMGYGSCASVCSNNAITIKDGIATVIPDRCGGCGSCVKICPKGLIKLIPYDSEYYVGCMSADKGAQTRSYCDVGCIGCKMCEKVCEREAVTVDGALAHINYDTCTNCGKCAEKCPIKIIVKTLRKKF